MTTRTGFLAAVIATALSGVGVVPVHGVQAGRGGTDAPVVPQPDRNANIPPISGPTSRTLRDSLTVPAGFKVEYFADSVPGARFMALGSDGAVYVSRPGGRSGPGQVLRLVDTNNDGRADSQSVALSGLTGPHGLAFHDGYLYVANQREVVRFRLDAGGVPGGAPDTVAHYVFTGGHSTRTVVFGKDGKMYVTVGSSCNICIEQDSTLAAALQFNPDGSQGRVFSAGLRNAVGMAVHPETGEIWVSSHERDNLQPDFQNLPHEEINILREGGHFGWPYCYGNRIPNPDSVVAAGVAEGRCASTLPPALEIQAHAAPLGMAFLQDATMFPAEYRGDLLLALHGSWNRNFPVGPTVVRVRVRDGKPVSYEEFVTGWQLGTREFAGRGGRTGAAPVRWGRPADVLVYKDGSVLISDDTRGAIFRVSR